MRDGDVGYFDRFARLYDAVMPSADPERLAAALDHADRDVDRIVDVGGGTGRAVAAVEAPDRIVVDASIGMLARVPPSIAAVRGSATRLPLRDSSADAVFVVDALHHLPRQRTVIEEAARVLRPGGVLVVLEFDRASLGGRLIELGEHVIGMESRFLAVDEIVDATRAAGLEPTTTSGRVVCTVVGRKPGQP